MELLVRVTLFIKLKNYNIKELRTIEKNKKESSTFLQCHSCLFVTRMDKKAINVMLVTGDCSALNSLKTHQVDANYTIFRSIALCDLIKSQLSVSISF